MLYSDDEQTYGQAKTRKRKREKTINEGEDYMKSYNRAVSLLTKPSYALSHPGLTKFQWEHVSRLCKILRELVMAHNWKEASGVASVLLYGTKKIRSPEFNRFKYSITVELLKRIYGDKIYENRSKIKNIYDIWISRTGSSKNQPVKERTLVYLEQILLFLTDGDFDDASQAVSSLMQHREFGSPMSYMVIGLTFYQLWYSKFQKDLELRDVDNTSSHSEMSETRQSNQVAYSYADDAANSFETGTSVRYNSETSVMNDKRTSVVRHENIKREILEDIDKLQLDSCPRLVSPLRTYLSSDENKTSLDYDPAATYDPSIFSALRGLESGMLPLRLPKDSELHVKMLIDSCYRDAVKYLRLALNLTPPELDALRPLVQLLLFGGQVDDALKEIEKFCNDSSAVYPLSLRASIWGHFNRNNTLLPTYYEDILKKDPTSGSSLSMLFKMHQDGKYSVESLVEMIALHLTATYPGYDTWRQFASCFLILAESNEDRLSVCHDSNQGEKESRQSLCYNKTPKIFIDGIKSWKLRCKLWILRHFSLDMLAADISEGDIQLLTYKAATGAHLYGEKLGYVLRVSSILEKHEDKNLLMFLKMHIQKSLRLHHSFQLINRTTQSP